MAYPRLTTPVAVQSSFELTVRARKALMRLDSFVQRSGKPNARMAQTGQAQ